MAALYAEWFRVDVQRKFLASVPEATGPSIVHARAHASSIYIPYLNVKFSELLRTTDLASRLSIARPAGIPSLITACWSKPLRRLSLNRLSIAVSLHHPVHTPDDDDKVILSVPASQSRQSRRLVSLVLPPTMVDSTSSPPLLRLRRLSVRVTPALHPFTLLTAIIVSI